MNFGVLSLVACTLIWGSTFVLVKGAVANLPVLTFLAFRFSLGGLVLLPWLKGSGSVRRFLPGALIGAANALGFFLQTAALADGATPDVVAFLTGLAVVLVPLVLAIYHRRLPALSVSAAVLIGGVGLYLLTVSRGLTFTPADLLAALGAVLFTFQVIGSSHFAPRLGAGRLAAQQVVTGGALFALAAAMTPGAGLHLPPSSEWAVIGYLGIGATSLAFLLQMLGQSKLDAVRSALIFNLEPVFAVLWAFALSGETLSGRALVGAACVLLAMFGVVWPAPHVRNPRLETASPDRSRLRA